MKRSRFSEEQIIAMLKEQEAGMPTADVCRKHGVDLSRICAAPSARLGHLAFEGQGAFASQC